MALHASEAEIRRVVTQLFGGGKGDITILDYIVGILSDEHFDFGEDGSEAYEVLGDILVRVLAWPGLGGRSLLRRGRGQGWQGLHVAHGQGLPSSVWVRAVMQLEQGVWHEGRAVLPRHTPLGHAVPCAVLCSHDVGCSQLPQLRKQPLTARAACSQGRGMPDADVHCM